MNLWSLRSEEAGKACTWDAEGVTPGAHGSFMLDLFLWMAPREELRQTDRQTDLLVCWRVPNAMGQFCQPGCFRGFGLAELSRIVPELRKHPTNRLGEIHNRQLAARRRDG